MLLSDLITPDDLFAALDSAEVITPRLDRLKPLLQMLKEVSDQWPFLSKKEKGQMMESWIFLVAHIDQAIEISTTRKG